MRRVLMPFCSELHIRWVGFHRILCQVKRGVLPKGADLGREILRSCKHSAIYTCFFDNTSKNRHNYDFVRIRRTLSHVFWNRDFWESCSFPNHQWIRMSGFLRGRKILWVTSRWDIAILRTENEVHTKTSWQAGAHAFLKWLHTPSLNGRFSQEIPHLSDRLILPAFGRDSVQASHPKSRPRRLSHFASFFFAPPRSRSSKIRALFSGQWSEWEVAVWEKGERSTQLSRLLLFQVSLLHPFVLWIDRSLSLVGHALATMAFFCVNRRFHPRSVLSGPVFRVKKAVRTQKTNSRASMQPLKCEN